MTSDRSKQKDHVHDCTGPTMTCSCGYKFTVPPIWVSIEIGKKRDLLLNEHFNCESLSTAIDALEEAAEKLRNLR